MPAELTLTRCQDGSFRPATSHDQDIAASWKIGQAIKVQAVQVKERSLQHHRLYWGGLIALAMDYWEPKGGLMSAAEVDTLKRFADWLDHKGGDTGSIRRAGKAFLYEMRESRARRIETPEKSKEALHRWIKEEAGYYDLEMTPRGVRKIARPTNFNAMGQDEFETFYKEAFSVVWRFILSQKFNNEAEAQQAIDQLIAMG